MRHRIKCFCEWKLQLLFESKNLVQPDFILLIVSIYFQALTPHANGDSASSETLSIDQLQGT